MAAERWSSGELSGQPGGAICRGRRGEWKRVAGATYRIKRCLKICSKSSAIKELISFYFERGISGWRKKKADVSAEVTVGPRCQSQ